MKRPALDALPFLSPDECHEHGMFAAGWLATPTNTNASPKKRQAAGEYMNAALTRWASQFQQTPPASEDLPIRRAPLACGGHAWYYRDDPSPTECHAPGCAAPQECNEGREGNG